MWLPKNFMQWIESLLNIHIFRMTVFKVTSYVKLHKTIRFFDPFLTCHANHLIK